MYFLDTNTCIYFLKGMYPSIKARLLSVAPSEIAIPSIVKAELFYRAYKSRKRDENLERIERFLEPFEIVAFDGIMSHVYAEIRQETELKGETIGPNDLFIAAIVKFHEGILVTNNESEFGQIPGMKIENWIEYDRGV